MLTAAPRCFPCCSLMELQVSCYGLWKYCTLLSDFGNMENDLQGMLLEYEKKKLTVWNFEILAIDII